MLFRPPVGDGGVPPRGWRISNPFGNYYRLTKGVPPAPDTYAYHTGLDLVLQEGSSAFQPIYAITDGVVTFARRVPNSSWGNVLVLQHTDGGGKHFYSRYGHDNDFLIAEGDRVCVGQMIAHVGNAFGVFAYHLHFDISLTETLLVHPADWPGLDMERLRQTYIDPLSFLKGQRMASSNELIIALAEQIVSIASNEPIPPVVPPTPTPTPDPAPNAKHAVVNASNGLKVRVGPGTSFAQMVVNGLLALLPNGDSEMVLDSGTPGWWKISGGQYDGGFASTQYLIVPN